ncbi:hypothetical protein J2S34_001449 [Nitrobacter winogradskyi]|uniref:Uncharacterized protein n=1 Tax=Nitrobacter winogradskyi TaxID=913 RepID=A0ACC6AHN0_NITWI|nr:hypothetical protein [Nitrobacter winogradskyi]
MIMSLAGQRIIPDSGTCALISGFAAHAFRTPGNDE